MSTSGNAERHSASAQIELSSYREVFDLERRIYRIDRLRLNPSGIPLRAAVYFGIGAALAAVLEGLPVADWLLRELPWYLRYVGIPGLIATIGSTVRIEGRPLHLAMRGLVLRSLRPKQCSGFARCAAIGSRWQPPPIIVVPDGSQAQPRRVRFTGPGALMLRSAHEIVEWRPGITGRLLSRPDLTIREVRGRTGDSEVAAGLTSARALVLGAGVRVEVEA